MKRIVLLYAALAVAALAWTGYWFFLADRAREAIDTGIATLDARGATVSYTERRVGGYPYRLSAAFTDLALAWSDGAAEWRWRSDSATAYAEPWDLRHYIGVFDGGHGLEIERGGRIAALDLRAETARASLMLGDDYEPLRAVAEVADLRIADARVGAGIGIAKLRLAARPSATRAPATDIALRVEELHLDENPQEVFGGRIGLLSADTVLTHPPEAWTMDALARWRDDGGALEVRALTVEWGAISLRGEGRLGLDPALRPQGEIDARVAGFPALIDMFAARGIIDEDAARVLQLALGLFAETPPGGGPPEVPLPIRLHDGLLRFGPVPLFPLDPVLGATPVPGG